MKSSGVEWKSLLSLKTSNNLLLHVCVWGGGECFVMLPISSRHGSVYRTPNAINNFSTQIIVRNIFKYLVKGFKRTRV